MNTMIKLAFLVRNAQDFTLFTFSQMGDLYVDTDQRTFVSMDLAKAYGQQGASAFFDYTHLPIKAEAFTLEHMQQLMNIHIATHEQGGFMGYAQAEAYLQSLLEPDTAFLALQKVTAFIEVEVERYKVVEVGNLVQAQDQLEDFNALEDVGGSTYGGGEVYRNGKLIGYLSYNGCLWDNMPWGGREHNAIEQFLDEVA